jgi:hypothetical protein
VPAGSVPLNTPPHSTHPNPQFFRQEDSTMNDAVTLCLLLAVLYAAYKAYATLFGA